VKEVVPPLTGSRASPKNVSLPLAGGDAVTVTLPSQFTSCPRAMSGEANSADDNARRAKSFLMGIPQIQTAGLRAGDRPRTR
jgi:hypothetical protein